MSEPIVPADPPKRTSLAKCERHGLHYDPAKMSGCVICRREAGGSLEAPVSAGVGAAVGRPPGAAAAAAGGAGSSSMVAPLLVAAVLCVGMGLALYELHDAVGTFVRSGGGYSAYDVDNLGKRRGRRMEEALRELNDVGGPSETSADESDADDPVFDGGPE